LPHDERYDVADEFVSLVTKLWGSWDQDAVTLDESGRLLHRPYEGESSRLSRQVLRVPRPSVALPPVSGPPGAVARQSISPRLKFTARHSDTVIATANGPDGMKAVRDLIRTTPLRPAGTRIRSR